MTQNLRNALERAVRRVTRSPEMVRGLRKLPDGPTYWLTDLKRGNAPIHWVCIGRDKRCDIVVDDNDAEQDEPADAQDVICVLRCTETDVMVCDPSGAPELNRVTLHEGRALLRPQVVLTVANTLFMACGKDDKVPPMIPVTGLPDLVCAGPTYHGTPANAADAFQISRSTFRRRLAKYTGAAVLCISLGTWQWSVTVDSTPPDSPQATQGLDENASDGNASTNSTTIMQGAASTPSVPPEDKRSPNESTSLPSARALQDDEVTPSDGHQLSTQTTATATAETQTPSIPGSHVDKRRQQRPSKRVTPPVGSQRLPTYTPVTNTDIRIPFQTGGVIYSNTKRLNDAK